MRNSRGRSGKPSENLCKARSGWMLGRWQRIFQQDLGIQEHPIPKAIIKSIQTKAEHLAVHKRNNKGLSWPWYSLYLQ